MILAIWLVLAAGAIGAFVALQVRHVRRVQRERRGILDPITPLLAEPHVTQDGIGYPKIEGRYRGTMVSISFLVDTLTMRQLPSLWMLVSVRRPLPLEGPIDILLRPKATDIVSPGERYHYEHPIPPDWPTHIRIGTTGPKPLRLDLLDEVLPLLDDLRIKDVLLAPGGVRVVRAVGHGEPGHYRVIRRTKFIVGLSAGEVAGLLDAALALAESIEQRLGPSRAC
jgi:hypothetical protein